MYVSHSEGANFWLGVITDLKQRGVRDLLIACIDGLKGFEEAIRTIFPDTEVQTCVVHQIRNSLKYVASKDQKVFMADLKPVYQAMNKDQAEANLLGLEEKWVKKYPVVIDSWRRHWDKLTAYFRYPDAIRKMIYTTNTIEGYHRQIRKVTENKGAFTSDMALLKLIYLATDRIARNGLLCHCRDGPFSISAKNYLWRQNEYRSMIGLRKKEAATCSLDTTFNLNFLTYEESLSDINPNNIAFHSGYHTNS
jgi:transposase-like protein